MHNALTPQNYLPYTLLVQLPSQNPLAETARRTSRLHAPLLRGKLDGPAEAGGVKKIKWPPATLEELSAVWGVRLSRRERWIKLSWGYVMEVKGKDDTWFLGRQGETKNGEAIRRIGTTRLLLFDIHIVLEVEFP
jgi:hypothetical protein